MFDFLFSGYYTFINWWLYYTCFLVTVWLLCHPELEMVSSPNVFLVCFAKSVSPVLLKMCNKYPMEVGAAPAL